MTIEKKKILDALEADLLNVSNIQDLQNIKARYLGKKGTVTDLMKEIGRIPPESKKEYGMLVNELKNDIEALLETKEEQVR
ncbi:MAG TPA: phenylalanine--tRNA ligase subunit alpha, partial [Petrotogaceae bacterium]|nr:phenylalanine--tRNA ligase subunit alpha [Petrotogaceae bacterium]